MLKNISSKKRKKRDSVIKCAGKVFKKLDYKKTSLTKIAKEAGIRKSSLYYYFSSKTDIFNAVILYEAIIYRKKVLASRKQNPF